MTTTNELIAAKCADPFRPFTVHLQDGERLIVDRADCFNLGHRRRTLALNTLDDRLRLIDGSLIEKLTPRGESGPRK